MRRRPHSSDRGERLRSESSIRLRDKRRPLQNRLRRGRETQPNQQSPRIQPRPLSSRPQRSYPDHSLPNDLCERTVETEAESRGEARFANRESRLHDQRMEALTERELQRTYNLRLLDP